jgi:heat shock protein HtpX
LQHRWLNRLQTGLLVLTLVGIAAAAGRLPFGEGCLWLALFAVAGALLLDPVAASALSLRLYRVRALHPQQAHEMWALLRELPARAGLPATPVPHYVPSAVVNAFATGSKQEASIALTDGLLRSLSPRELAGVFAYEVAHIAMRICVSWGWRIPVSRLTPTGPYGMILLSLPALLVGAYGGLLAWSIVIGRIAPTGLPRTAGRFRYA